MCIRDSDITTLVRIYYQSLTSTVCSQGGWFPTICCCYSKGPCRFLSRWSGFCRRRRHLSFCAGCCSWLLLLLWINYCLLCCYSRFGFFGKKRSEARLPRFCCRWMVRELSLTAMLTLVAFANKISFLRIARCFVGTRCWAYIANGRFAAYATVLDAFTCTLDAIHLDNCSALTCSVRHPP